MIFTFAKIEGRRGDRGGLLCGVGDAGTSGIFGTLSLICFPNRCDQIRLDLPGVDVISLLGLLVEISATSEMMSDGVSTAAKLGARSICGRLVKLDSFPVVPCSESWWFFSLFLKVFSFARKSVSPSSSSSNSTPISPATPSLFSFSFNLPMTAAIRRVALVDRGLSRKLIDMTSRPVDRGLPRKLVDSPLERFWFRINAGRSSISNSASELLIDRVLSPITE